MSQITADGAVVVENSAVVVSEFVELGKLAYTTGKNAERALNKVAEGWMPIIRERMEAAGAKRSEAKEEPTTSAIVRQVTLEFYAEFFNSFDSAMADLRAVGARKGMGITTISDADHMALILKKCGAMSSMGGGLKYFDNEFRKVRNALGFRERKDRKDDKSGVSDGKGDGVVAEEAIPPKDSTLEQTVGGVIVPKGLAIGDAIVALLEGYEVAPGEGYVNWFETLYAVADAIRDAGAAPVEVEAEGELVAA